MIRRLRRRHLRVMLVLTILLPVLIGAAIVARRGTPRQPIPPELVQP